MSKLDELIDKLCPDGVEFKKIEDFTLFEQPTKYIVKSTKYDDSYETPVLTAGQTFILGYTNEEEGIYNVTKKNPVIIFDDFTGSYKWVDFPFKVKSSAMKIITPNEDKVLIRFLYHMMGFLNFASDEHKRLWISIYSQIKIPVPPLEVQCEIVRILDKFTLLTAELTAELTARRKQYEYYRKYLLRISGEIKELGDISEFSTGEKPKEILIEKNSNLYQYINAGTTNSGYSNLSNRSKDAVTTPSRGQGGIGFVGYQENEFWLGPLCYAIYSKDKTILNPKYLYYELYSKKDEILKRKNTGGVPSLNARDLKTILINIPSIDEQIKIVDILDRFDKLCNDIISGLPAEIELNNKRYEYYRDKLLTFKEKNNG